MENLNIQPVFKNPNLSQHISLTIAINMCYSVLTLCPDCRSNIRQLHPCTSGTTVSSSFKYTDKLTADVCSSTGALLSVRFETGICKDCIRYAKAKEAARANLHQWQSELDDITKRSIKHGRRSALKPASAHPKKAIDDSGGRKALLKLWYEEAKVRNLMTLDSASIAAFVED